MSVQRIVVLAQMLIVIMLAVVCLLLKKRLTIVGKDCVVVQHAVPRRRILLDRGLHRNNWTRVHIAAARKKVRKITFKYHKSEMWNFEESTYCK